MVNQTPLPNNQEMACFVRRLGERHQSGKFSAVTPLRNMSSSSVKCRAPAFTLSVLILILLACGRGLAAAAMEETYPLLQIGTITYTNVTVTTKAKKYIFILHSTGMANIRVADLPPDISKAMGYVELEKKDQAKVAAATAWARQTLARFETPAVMAMEQKVQQGWQSRSAEQLKQALPANQTTVLAALGCLLALFLFFCYCCMLICKKTGHEPGVLIWLPLLQIFPLLRAAGMSPLWFLAYLIPGLNILAQIVLSFKLAKARGKSAWVGFFLLVPVISLFAFLYLAFSGGPPAERGPTGPTRRPTRLMTFKAA